MREQEQREQAERQQQIELRAQHWAMVAANGVLSASCADCGWPLLVTWGKGSTKDDLNALDEHQAAEHNRCSGRTHTTPHNGCVLR